MTDSSLAMTKTILTLGEGRRSLKWELDSHKTSSMPITKTRMSAILPLNGTLFIIGTTTRRDVATEKRARYKTGNNPMIK